jgi:hypothetical protein
MMMGTGLRLRLPSRRWLQNTAGKAEKHTDQCGDHPT